MTPSILQKCGMPQNNKMTSVPIVYDSDCDSNIMKNLILQKCGMPHFIKMDFLLPMERVRIDEIVRSAASLTSDRPTQKKP
jgi:hypothetical protein